MAEVERVLVEYKGLAVERAAYLCEWIRPAFPEGRVAPEVYLPLVESRTGSGPDDHVHGAAAMAGGATVVLSADKKGYPPADIAPARCRDSDVSLTELLRRYPQEVAGTVDAMSAAVREPLTRGQVLDRLAAAGAPKFVACVAAVA